MPVLVGAVAAGGSVGLGAITLAVAFILAFGASLSLRSIWAKQTKEDPDAPRTGRLDPRAKQLRSPALGPIRTRYRLLLSFDFGCLAIASAVLLLVGLILIFRGLGV
ncbi:MAG: hypothetical protein M0027_13755 [Candidatus Dormibacteraeota bacterium]|nr:hypothetical protein [Candidatus Dormibacteraeota bacterium]